MDEPALALKEDYLAGVIWHIDRIDWTLNGLTPDAVTGHFIGTTKYWNLPQFEEMDAVNIEIEILANVDVFDWHTSSPWKPYYQHFLTLIKLLCPATDITPNLADVVMVFCLGLGHDRKLTSMIGSQNSGKSAVTARIIMTCMAINPDMNFGLVANPYKTTSESTIWGDIKEVYDEINLEHPQLWPESKIYADKRLVLKKVAKAGYVELRPVDKMGKLKGTKTKKVKHPKTGKYITPLFLLGLDEVNEIKSQAFLEVVSNICSQEGFHGFPSQNFKMTNDMGGRIAEPKNRPYGGPGSYDDLTKEHRYWHSFSSGVTLRFNGLESPNFKAGWEIYPYLFRLKNLNHIVETYGENSPEYYSQVLSFPIESAEIVCVVSSSTVKRSRYEDKFFTRLKSLGKIAFGDPAFGGHDLCLWGWGEVAVCRIADPGGLFTQQTLLLVENQFHKMHLNRDMVVDDALLVRLEKLDPYNKIARKHFVPGSVVSYDDQIAIQYAEKCVLYGIPYSHFGYDFSLRHEIVNSVHRIMGSDAVSFAYDGPPVGIHLQGLKMNSEKCCGNRMSELAFMAADLVDNKQIRGEALGPGLIQLARTCYATKGEKRFVEKKKDYKLRWSNVSPDARDVFIGMTGMAARLGLVLNNPLTPADGSAKGDGGYRPLKPVRRPAKL